MANIIKYTGQTITAKLGALSNGNHFECSYFKADANSISGLTTNFNKFSAISTSALGIPNLEPSTSASTITITGKPHWDNGNDGVPVSASVEIRQATTFYKTGNTELWVGGTAAMSYTLTNMPYDKAVSISVAEGPLAAGSKAASAPGTSLTVTAKKSGAGTVTFTPNTTAGLTGAGNTTVTVRQPITAITVDKTSANVNLGGSVTIKIAVSATNSNDSSATTNIYRPTLFHSFNGTATGSTSTSAALTVEKGTTATTALTLTNITKGGIVTLAALAGAPGTTNAAIPSGSSLSKTITITLKTISITLYKDSGCATAKSENAINAGDYFFIKVSGGAGTTGTLSCGTTGITIGTTSVSDNGGTSKITVATNVTSAFKIKFTPTNGSAIESASISIKTPTLTLY